MCGEPGLGLDVEVVCVDGVGLAPGDAAKAVQAVRRLGFPCGTYPEVRDLTRAPDPLDRAAILGSPSETRRPVTAWMWWGSNPRTGSAPALALVVCVCAGGCGAVCDEILGVAMVSHVVRSLEGRPRGGAPALVSREPHRYLAAAVVRCAIASDDRSAQARDGAPVAVVAIAASVLGCTLLASSENVLVRDAQAFLAAGGVLAAAREQRRACSAAPGGP